MVGIPIYLVVIRIMSRSKASMGNAEAVERIQDLLHVFEDNCYGTYSPYPKQWADTLAQGRLKRQSPIQKSAILSLMAACVIATVWLIL